MAADIKTKIDSDIDNSKDYMLGDGTDIGQIDDKEDWLKEEI